MLDLSPLALVQRAHTALLLVDRLARCVGEVFSTFSPSLCRKPSKADTSTRLSSSIAFAVAI
ncbi:hypothetical protein ACJX0J_028243, partial [Zea mays]